MEVILALLVAVLLVFFLGFGAGFMFRSYISYRRRHRRRSSHFSADDRPAPPFILERNAVSERSPSASPTLVPLNGDHKSEGANAD
jgi:hypothetical protein